MQTPQEVEDIETSVVAAFSLLEELQGNLPETEDEEELRKALWGLDSRILKSEEELIEWALQRWFPDPGPCTTSECTRAGQSQSSGYSSPAGWVTDVTAAPSDTKQLPFRPFQHLLNQYVEYTGETPRQHNDGHTILKGQRFRVQEVKVNGMKLYGHGMGEPFWSSFNSWSLIDPSESSSESSFGVFKKSKCLTCLSPSVYKNQEDKVCSRCEEQLAIDWSDEAMKVIIHRPPASISSTTLGREWRAEGIDNSWKLLIVYKFYKGSEVREFHYPQSGRKFDIAERVHQKKNSLAYKQASRKAKQKNKEDEERTKKESKKEWKKRNGSQLTGENSCSSPVFDDISWPWLTSNYHWSWLPGSLSSGQSSWTGGDFYPCSTGQSSSESWTWGTGWTQSLPCGPPPGLSHPCSTGQSSSSWTWNAVWTQSLPCGSPPRLPPPPPPPPRVETGRPGNGFYSQQPETIERAGGKNETSTVEGKHRIESKAQGDTDEQLCPICLDEKKEWMCEPCRHVCLCGTCKKKRISACPICREDVKAIVQVFL